eukprot:gene16298-19383_t
MNSLFMAALLARYYGRSLQIQGPWVYGEYHKIFDTSSLANCPNVSMDPRFNDPKFRMHTILMSWDVLFYIPTPEMAHGATKRTYIDQFKCNESMYIPSDITFAMFRETARYIYRPTREMAAMINNVIQDIKNFPYSDPYFAIHIRRGDKIEEASLKTTLLYVEALESKINSLGNLNTSNINVFVASDAIEKVIQEIASIRPTWHLYRTLRPEHNNTYSEHNQTEFRKRSKEERFQETIYLMADLEILRSSSALVCTLSSNICTLLQLIRTQSPHTLASLDEQYYSYLPWPELRKVPLKHTLSVVQADCNTRPRLE